MAAEQQSSRTSPRGRGSAVAQFPARRVPRAWELVFLEVLQGRLRSGDAAHAHGGRAVPEPGRAFYRHDARLRHHLHGQERLHRGFPSRG